MSLLPISERKRRCLDSLSTPAGVIAALAIDQRKSLRRMIADAAGDPLEQISDQQLRDFKTCVTSELSKNVSAVLLDPEYGLEAAKSRAPQCGLLVAYELDGYENPRPHRMLALMPHLSVRRLKEAGAQGVKILLHYAPDDDAAANDEKCALIERIGSECDAVELPFFLEPVVYDPAGTDPRSPDFAKRKPQLVIRTIEEFSKDIYRVDVLKVEFPVITAFVEGSTVNSGQAVYSKAEALDAFGRADAAARRPYIYLSAGVSIPEFLASLKLANEAHARYSGVLCGRANWKDGVPVFAQSGAQAVRNWLSTNGIENVAAINRLLESATPWRHWYERAA